MSEYCLLFSQNSLEAWYSIRFSLKIYTYGGGSSSSSSVVAPAPPQASVNCARVHKNVGQHCSKVLKSVLWWHNTRTKCFKNYGSAEAATRHRTFLFFPYIRNQDQEQKWADKHFLALCNLASYKERESHPIPG
jgi:hypothetical protein